MQLDFMLVPGINDANIIVFGFASLRESYMQNHIVKSINYSFFPPRYTDSIKVDITDVNFDTNVNYLRFSWNNKYYYYFIEDVRYISEDVLEINIRMDTVMTYYFDININDGIIERKHIRRYVSTGGLGYKFNRDYIRENVSDGLFLEREKNYIVKPDDLKWMVVKLTAELRVGVTIPRRTLINSPYRDSQTPIPYGIYIGPWDNKDIQIHYQDSIYDTATYPYVSVLEGLGDNRVVNIFLLPFNPVMEMEYDESTGHLAVLWNSADAATDCRPCVANNDSSIPSFNNSKTAVFTQAIRDAAIPINAIEFERNTSSLVPFDKKYEPSLLDESYMRIGFGSENAKVTYPVHVLEYDFALIGSYTCNLDDGTITYTISGQMEVLPTRFSGIAIDDDVPSLALNNEPWKDYLANIHGRMAAMGVNMVSSVADCFISMGTSNAAAAIKSNRILNDKRAWDRRYKKSRKLKNKYADRINAIKDDVAIDTKEAIGSLGSSIISTMGNELSTAMVAAYTPPTVRNLGNVLDSDSAYKLAIWYQWSVVEDIEWVAWYYHKYGNLVNKPYLATGQWYNEFLVRKYYNYIKFGDINLTLSVMSEEDVVDDIRDRFISGMTMWSNEYDIGSTYKYDNVEL